MVTDFASLTSNNTPDTSPEASKATPSTPLENDLVCCILRILNVQYELDPKKICERFSLDYEECEPVIGQLMRFSPQSHVRNGHPLIQQLLARIINVHKTAREDDPLKSIFSGDLAPVIYILSRDMVSADYIVSEAARRLFGIDTDHFQACSSYLAGTYNCYKYAKDGRILIERHIINKHDITHAPSRFTTKYKRAGTGDRIHDGKGYVLPFGKDFFALCEISREREEYPDPTFTFLKNPRISDFTYMKGVCITTDISGYSWASNVYMGRTTHDSDDNALLKTERLDNIPLSLRHAIEAVIGQYVMSAPSVVVDGEIQKILNGA